MNDLIRIPLAFYDDHQARDLDTPEMVKRTKRHGYIRADDPALPELLDDARHYAHPYGPDTPGLRTAAKALIRAIEQAH